MITGLVFFLAVQLTSSTVTTTQANLQIDIPTVEEETSYVWRTIIDTKFFEENGYQVSLPSGPLIEKLKEKAKRNQLSDQDEQDLKDFMKNTVYDQQDYKMGLNKILEQKNLLEKMVGQLKAIKTEWPMTTFDQYRVILTLYGPGGSYNPDNGSIILYTNKEGGFKNYKNPANTIIHEIVHISTEAPIMQKYQVYHSLKERIIDNLVLLLFAKNLPDYRMQPFGDERIDDYLTRKKDFKQLRRVIEAFNKKYVK